ncbi:MAG TPA: hypothetical protein VJP79_00770 [Nitrososphaera sp.]|nr:hypothetical protein [Nitrososphaera sp.]
MTITVTFFESVPDFKKHVDAAIAETKTTLGVTLQKTEEVRKRYEVVKKHFDSLRKLSGKKEIPKDTKQMEVASFRVLINPSADYELTLMEESVSSLQDKLESFEKTKELFPSLTEDKMKIAMVLNEGIPAGFMLYVPNL